jgi:hypothetical protein
MQCSVLNDWSQVIGNPVKFGLGFVSLSFDTVFMIQHWILFPQAREQQVADQEAVEAVSEQVQLLADSEEPAIAQHHHDDSGGPA